LLAQAVGLLKQHGQLAKDVQVFIIGESDGKGDPFLKLLDDAIDQYQLADIVHQHPKTSQPEAFYHAADFTVLASLWEGLPNVILESLAAGRPVIVSEAANNAGVIEQGVNGWIVRTNDAEHLAETLKGVLTLSDAELAAMRPACQQTAARFAMQTMVDQYQALYERIALNAGKTVPQP
jgi:starch synthase (maltosyl-transferring)